MNLYDVQQTNNYSFTSNHELLLASVQGKYLTSFPVLRGLIKSPQTVLEQDKTHVNTLVMKQYHDHLELWLNYLNVQYSSQSFCLNC